MKYTPLEWGLFIVVGLLLLWKVIHLTNERYMLWH